MKSLQRIILQSVFVIGLFSPSTAWAADPRPVPLKAAAAIANMALSFEVNQGQADPEIKFLSRGPGYSLLLTSEDAVLQLLEQSGPAAVRMKFGSAKVTPEIDPLDKLPGQVNYLIGNDPSKWHTDVPHYARVRYRQVSPGVDLIFYGNQQRLEYDFVVSPGADPNKIVLQYEGARNLLADAHGDLLLETAAGRMVQAKPLVYQEVNGDRKVIAGSYVLKGGNQVGFEVADDYDPARPLVIDPTVVFFTYLGGGGDKVTSMSVDSTGNIYVGGVTSSARFPTTGPFQGAPGGGLDGFITKLVPGGGSMIYSTYLGGSGDDAISGLAVGGRAGNVYVTGYTASANFPTFIPMQASSRGGAEAFVSELNTAGNGLVFSTYLGGSGEDRATGIALDADSNVFLTGFTASNNFPTASPFQPTFAGGPFDAFVTKINPLGSQLVFSTFLGGSGPDQAFGIAVDPLTGQAFVTGGTESTDFPTTPGAYQPTNRGGSDIFLTGFNPAGSTPEFSTFIGGTGNDVALGLAIGPNGLIGLTGQTASRDFPIVAVPASYGGGDSDMFAVEASRNISSSFVRLSTLIGGSGNESGNGVAFDPLGDAVFTGATNSPNLKIINPLQSAFAGGESDVLIAGFNSSPLGQILSYYGGPGVDSGLTVFYDPLTNRWWVAGETVATDGLRKGFLTSFGDAFPPR